MINYPSAPFLKTFNTTQRTTESDNLNGVNLKIIAQYDPSYEERITIKEYDNGTVEYTKGMCLDILLALQVAMGFKYIALKGNGWGGLHRNGTWTGMAAQIINEEADLSIAQASMIMSMNIMTKISFLQVTGAGHLVAIFKQPRNSLSKNLMTSAFTKGCWAALLFSWTIFALVVKLVSIIQIKMDKRQNESDTQFSSEILLWTLTTAIGKSWFINPSNQYLRMTCLVSAGLACCVLAAYSSQFTVNLITENLPIKSFQDLMQSNLELSTDKFLPPNLVVRRLNDKSSRKNERLDVFEALRLITKPSSSLAYVTLSDSVADAYFEMKYTDITFCKTISRVGLYNQETPAAMFVKKGSPLKEILNLNILKLIQTGIKTRLNNDYTKRTEIQCLPKQNNYRGGLGWHDVFTSFVVLLGGFFTSNLFFIIEVVLRKK